MDHLTSPKITPGVHCLNLRHKGMYVTSGPDPDEFSSTTNTTRRPIGALKRSAASGPTAIP